MAQFRPILNVWNLTAQERATLQPGQWVTAGEGESAPRGRYLGQTRGESDVVAWLGNMTRHPLGAAGYMRNLRRYARAHAPQGRA